jgi:hypothetical protein
MVSHRLQQSARGAMARPYFKRMDDLLDCDGDGLQNNPEWI